MTVAFVHQHLRELARSRQVRRFPGRAADSAFGHAGVMTVARPVTGH